MTTQTASKQNPYHTECRLSVRGDRIGWVSILWGKGKPHAGSIYLRPGGVVYLCKPGTFCSDTGCRVMPHLHQSTLREEDGELALPLAIWRAIKHRLNGYWPLAISVGLDAMPDGPERETRALIKEMLKQREPYEGGKAK